MLEEIEFPIFLHYVLDIDILRKCSKVERKQHGAQYMNSNKRFAPLKNTPVQRAHYHPRVVEAFVIPPSNLIQLT